MSEEIISLKSKVQWLSTLPNKIFKILPIYENEDIESYRKYVDKLAMRVSKFNELNDSILTDVVLDLIHIRDTKMAHKELRKIVLDDARFVNDLYESLLNE